MNFMELKKQADKLALTVVQLVRLVKENLKLPVGLFGNMLKIMILENK